MFDLIDQFLRRSRRKINRSEWAIRRFKLSTFENTRTAPGLLLIQIDGLSRRQMERALHRKRLPFLKTLIERQHYELNTFYSGIPSTTPAVQAELHYGVKCAVPAFSFLDRSTKRIATMFQPGWAKAVEKKLAAENEPLLQGGSSWSNIYTGGATQAESHFCGASIGPGDLWKSASIFGFLTVILFYFTSILRLIGLAFVEFFVALWDAARGVFRGESFFKEFKFLFVRIFVCVALREFIVIGTKVDLARGLPIIHLNFLGYDEQSHRRGPNSLFAHWSLLGIDHAVKRLYREARRSTRRDYQVWIFSDHGQEATSSFEVVFPGGVEQAISAALAVDGETAAPRQARPQPPHSNWQSKKKARRYFDRRETEELLSEEEQKTFSVAAMGPVGHVYLTKIFSLEEKRALAERLVRTQKIPGVLFKNGPGGATWVHAGGTIQLPQDANRFLPHPGELKEAVARDLIAVCEHESAGDILLLGWSPDAPAISFPVEQGAHAGPGLDETQGFCLLPRKTRVPETAKEFIRATDLRAAAFHFLGRKKIALPKRERLGAGVRPLRVMSYNVHSCRGMDGRISPDRIARVIEMNDPDIVALQEIDVGRTRSNKHDQAKMLADLVGMHAYFCPTVKQGEEHYGHAILSRLPVKIVRIDTFNNEKYSPRKEPRGVLWGCVEIDGIRLHILSTHLGLGRRERIEQSLELMSEKWIGGIDAGEPVLLCGDFNTRPNTPAYRTLNRRLHDVQRSLKNHKPQKTFSAFLPFTRIDHIFISDHFQPECVFVPKNHWTRVASDHLPLVADLVFKKDLTMRRAPAAGQPSPA
ncbi:MAG: endonuclease/exonuclease/phosphatase family protein [Verrucomicrobiota bacterium]